MNLKELSKGINNNVYLIRFLAACLVIASHAFVLAENRTDFISGFTNGQSSGGNVAVMIFFAFSGFYTAKSIIRKSDLKKFFWVRIKKIFPPLILVVLLSTFILGPVMSSLSMRDYFLSTGTYKYLVNMFLIPVHELPGVFTKCKTFSTVNGALWTLSVEFVCYICLMILSGLKLLDKKRVWISSLLLAVFVGGVYTVATVMNVSILMQMVAPIVSFYVGVLLYVFADQICVTKKMMIINALIIVVAGIAGILPLAMCTAFPVFIISLALYCKQVSSSLNIGGMLSYSMYLVGFPIQQVIVSINGGSMSAYVNFLFALPIDIICAAIIYFIAEKPFQKKHI